MVRDPYVTHLFSLYQGCKCLEYQIFHLTVINILVYVFTHTHVNV